MADRLVGLGVTRREAEVLAALGEHLSNAEIAARLYVSERTVESHVSSLLSKFHATNRRQLLRLSSASTTGTPSDEAAAPATLTFLFTDIVDSTVLWERFPRLMPDALARHDGVIRRVVADHLGDVFTAAGDGFGVAFTSASGAVDTAVDAQRALGGAAWPPGTAIQVRMGLHTGTASTRGGDYFGAAVNRAARICEAGNGGQVLLSAATAALVADESWVLTDLGEHRLKGIARPQRLFRLDVEDLPVVDRPLRAAPDRPGNLPPQRLAIVGRDRELTELLALLDDHRVITVVGAGGAGKTRLAIAAAAAAAHQFPDGVWFVELAEVAVDDDVATAVVSTLGLHPASSAADVSAVAASLNGQQALVILDNCEHVLDGVVALTEQIGTRCPNVTIVATSREALDLSDEAQFHLAPLQLRTAGEMSDAACLFTQRARSVVGLFTPSPDQQALVENVCQRLDGLPLAIELAAARLSAMSLVELSELLDDRLDVIARRRATVPRQRSLEATIGWSYDLLSAEEQALFDRLSVFGSEFDFAAASAVSGTSGPSTRDELASLVDKSLVTAVRGYAHTRFRVLETIRRYGEERLAARGETATVRTRYLDHYLAWTAASDAGIKGPEELTWHEGLVAEWPNVRQAVRLACTLDNGDAACRLVWKVLRWATTRIRLEAAQWCDSVLDLPSTLDHPLRPILLAGAALFAHMRDDATSEARYLALATAEEERLGPAIEPWPALAVLNQWKGGPAAARADAAAFIERARSCRDEYWALTANLDEALILAVLIDDRRLGPGDEAAARDRILEVTARADSFGLPGGIAAAQVMSGLALRRSDPAAARDLLERGLDVSDPLEIEDISNLARQTLASLYTELGRPADALALMRPSLALYLRAGAWHELSSALVNVASALADLGHPDVAAAILGRLSVHGDVGDVAPLTARLCDALGEEQLNQLRDRSTNLALPDVGHHVVSTIDQILA